MVDYDKNKKIKQKKLPQSRNVNQSENPEKYYKENPAWTFLNSDKEMWAFSENYIKEKIWTEIIPFLESLESKTWAEILVQDKKQNHSIGIKDLNKIARDRLAQKYIEAESIISLRITGTHRLYGYMTGRVFNILWFDTNHGDSKTCVCRSFKKHT